MSETLATTDHTPTLTRGRARWIVVQDRIARGLCRDCGEKRGKDGTANRCAACSEKRRAYQQEWRARKAAAPATAPELARALGDTAPRVPRTRPGPDPADRDSLAIGARGEVIQMTITRSEAPSLSVLDPAEAWTRDHWRVRLERKRARAARGSVERIAPFVISAGADYGGQPPSVRDVLALLLLDAADAGRPLAEWAATFRLSPHDVRVVRNHRAANKRAAALRRLLAGKAWAEVAAAVLPAAVAGEVAE